MRGTISWPVLLTLACSGGGDDERFGLEQREIVMGLTFPTGYADPTPLTPVDVFPALSFASPLAVMHAGDGTDRLFVVEQGGRIRVFDNDPNVVASEVFLDISDRVIANGERGLLGLAFDPDYETNGSFYVYYSASTSTPNQDHRSVVSRFQVTADPSAADPNSETVLSSFDQPYGNHNAGCLAFGPDGMLYIGSGDGGSANDPQRNAQNRTNLLGKVLRIEPDGSIPQDNPFVGEGGGVREEIWAYGLRNPFRFAFDRATGDLWLGDVGQNAIEEVDLIQRGGNYGWVHYEGTRPNVDPGGLAFADTIPPVIEYPHALGQSVTGGTVYRGALNPSLNGAYLYGDFVSGRIWALVHDGEQVISNEQVAQVANPSSFGEDEAGELYVTSFDGSVYRLEETMTGPRPPFPERLSETGLFTEVVALTPTPGLLEYDVNVELWSDGARKRRWLALPSASRIDFHPTEAWAFPGGTVTVKHFELETSPGEWRRLETRVLIHEDSGWRGYTYRWNDAQTDADLLVDGLDETISVVDDLGVTTDLDWHYPSRAECLACHTQAAGFVLGLRTRQLNRGRMFPSLYDNQLRAWNHIELFDADIGSSAQYARLPPLSDTAATTTDRARAYLDVNCAQCHQPGGPAPGDVDLRFDTPTALANVVLAPPQSGDLGITGATIVAPGAKELSVLWERMRVLGDDRMPPLGTVIRHDEAISIVGEWIDSGAD
ncbi:MAG: PQQ-dependent sugar dehydrogenase [Planctomycetota bacterium]